MFLLLFFLKNLSKSLGLENDPTEIANYFNKMWKSAQKLNKKRQKSFNKKAEQQ